MNDKDYKDDEVIEIDKTMTGEVFEDDFEAAFWDEFYNKRKSCEQEFEIKEFEDGKIIKIRSKIPKIRV